jgi:hypothetical protein
MELSALWSGRAAEYALNIKRSASRIDGQYGAFCIPQH